MPESSGVGARSITYPAAEPQCTVSSQRLPSGADPTGRSAFSRDAVEEVMHMLSKPTVIACTPGSSNGFDTCIAAHAPGLGGINLVMNVLHAGCQLNLCFPNLVWGRNAKVLSDMYWM